MLKTRTYPRLVRLLHDPRLRTLVALQLVLSTVGVVLPPRSLLVTLDNPRTCDLLGHNDNSALDGQLPGVLVSPSDNPSRCDRAVHSCSMLPSGILPGGAVHTSRMGPLPGQSRWYRGVPRPCCGFTVGLLSPISFSVPLQFCQEYCIHCVWSLCWVLVHRCSHTPTFFLPGGLSRRPGDPSCRSLGRRGCPCNFGVLGRHHVDKRRDI
ncbi:hypothetical protein F2Q69_00054878 [Brassica cretica]|uniref:Uncharacterized protein n=1 Tax=Brassica cretica TaxID=69181 RepID=A0A8S9N4B8_BRACR|nr:hypothetical protein F2Q69_00054878 [Brassica cretica]